ncbi:MAG: hypothetical protein AAGK22_10055 [Acidobacteriota bacterium]
MSSPESEKLLLRTVARLRATVMSVVFAMVCGGGLFLATVWLLIRGGPDVGQHLGLLGQYFPGYIVSWPGAFLGLLYGGAVGAVIGWTTAWVYNTLANLRS